jgi:hypothetical protein
VETTHVSPFFYASTTQQGSSLLFQYGTIWMQSVYIHLLILFMTLLGCKVCICFW